ncbi:MAG: T9SS type A sorting domain-containing protein [Paludibacteraceae bacterium]
MKTQKYTEQQLLMVDLDAPAGIYFLNITTSAGQGTFKLIRK